MPDPRKIYALPAYSITLAGGALPPIAGSAYGMTSSARRKKDALSLENIHLDPRNLLGLLRYLG